MVILNESKIKYEKLDELLSNQLCDIRFSQQVNIIVDLKEIIKKFFRPDIMPVIQNKKLLIEEISSDIINIIAHYRNYFYKKDKYTNFYFLYSYEKCQELIEQMPDYKKEYYEKYFEDEENADKIDVIKRSIKTAEKVISLIPNAVFVDTSKHDELVYMKYIISQIQTNQITLILSNDELMYQLLDKHVFLLNLKGINSKLVTTETAVEVLTKRESILSSNLVPLIIAISGNKKYCFKGISRIAIIKATQVVEALVKKGIVLDVDSIDVPIEFSKLQPTKDKLDSLVFCNKDQIIENYKLIRNDKNLFENKILISTEISSAYKKKPSYNYFLELNAKVFTTFPLNLSMLLKGEKI